MINFFTIIQIVVYGVMDPKPEQPEQNTHQTGLGEIVVGYECFVTALLQNYLVWAY